MDMKALELQFALHKNDEAGVKQQQHIHKPVQDQAELASVAAKQIVEDRKKTAPAEQSAKLAVKPEEERSREQAGSGPNVMQDRKGKAEADLSGASAELRRDHPFKGHHIDLWL